MFKSNRHTDFYIDYHRIQHHLFRERIRYYEEHRDVLHFLSFDQRIEVDIDYNLCLFEIGKYNRFLQNIDHLIESVIIEDIRELNGKDIYCELLIKKAACLYNTDRFEESIHISKQLLKINPDEQSKMLYAKCKRCMSKEKFDWMRATSVVFMLSGLSLSLCIVLVFKPFYSEYVNHLANLRNFLFLCGVLLMIFQELYITIIIAKETGLDSKKNPFRRFIN